MHTLRSLYLAMLALVAVSAPLGAYTGYYGPECRLAVVWTPSGYQTQNVCF